MLFKGAFCALCHPCNLQGVLEFDCIYIAHLVPWSQSHLGFPCGQHHFPMMDAGGSPFPHNDGASMDGGMMVAVGTIVSSTCCSDPTGGSTVWGPTSMGSALGNSIVPPGGMSGAPVLQHHHFLDVLLSICLAMSESVADSHSCHSRVAETSLCFPLLFPSFWRWCSSDSALQQCSFLLELSCSCSDFVFLITSWYLSRYHDSLPWASSTALSSICATTRGHGVQNASSIR